MNNSNSHVTNKHIDEWSLAYLEDVLSPDERTQVEEHLKQCQSCARETEDMSQWVMFLNNNRQALCPEEWELFDYARGGRDVTGLLASHLSHCPTCRETVEAFRVPAPAKGVPNALWRRMTRSQETRAKETAGIDLSWLNRLWEQITSAFTPPLAMAGAVAVAALLVVILYPATPGPFLGLSTVRWAPDHESMALMGEPERITKGIGKQQRLATIVYFKHFKRKPDSDRINAVYRLLEPGRRTRLQYDVVSPSQVKEALERARIKGGAETEVLPILRDKLSVSRALIVVLSEKGDLFSIQARLTDTATGKVLQEHKIADVRAGSLAEEVEAASESVLKPN